MSRRPCPNPQEGCKYAPDCFADTHHPAWPRSEYTSRAEKLYRAAGAFTICRALHDIEHTYQPPEKPSAEEMRQAIASDEVA